MRAKVFLIILAFLMLPAASGATGKGLTVKSVRSSTYATFTRIVCEVEAASPYVLTRSQDGLTLMLGSYEGPLVVKAPLPAVRDGLVSGMELSEESGRTFLVVHLASSAGETKDFSLRGPDRIVLDIRKGAAAANRQDQQPVVVLDPGHGGNDPGLLTPQSVEKTFDLELALSVARALRQSGRTKVSLTREKDQALTLDERAASANAAGAAVFVSLHGAPGAGVRVFIEEVADDTETAPTPPEDGDFLGYESRSERQETLWSSQQAPHAQQSGELGRLLARGLSGSGEAEPVQTPLAELKTVDAAAVLIEVGMGQDLARMAQGIAAGIEQYVTNNR